MTNISFLSLKVVKESSSRYNIARKINNPNDIVKVAIDVIGIHEQSEESLWLITLDIKNNITGLFEVSRGSISTSIVHPREVYKRAMLQNSASIILIHNHPSGDPTPSQEDIAVTKKLEEAGIILGINLIDHVIVGDDGKYKSLKEMDIIR